MPGTPHLTEKIIRHDPLAAKKIDISQLLHYISLDTQRLEGELSQIPASRPGLTQSLLTLGFTEASLQHLDIEDRDYCGGRLRDSASYDETGLAQGHWCGGPAVYINLTSWGERDLSDESENEIHVAYQNNEANKTKMNDHPQKKMKEKDQF